MVLMAINSLGGLATSAPTPCLGFRNNALGLTDYIVHRMTYLQKATAEGQRTFRNRVGV